MLSHIQRHPPVLKIFFATEMWERYGFYVVQTLLALYLALHFHWQDDDIYTLVSSFTGLTYLSPILGGFVADHWIGQKRAVFLGIFFLFISYLALATMSSDFFLRLSLASTAIGTGLLKPNISSLLGKIYPEKAPERESGFTLFYMGITLGIMFGTTLPSYLLHQFGWPTTYASAAIGIIFAAYLFYYGVKYYQIEDCQKSPASAFEFLVEPSLTILAFWLISLAVLFYSSIGTIVFGTVLCLSVGYVIYAAGSETYQQSKQTLVLGLLCLISVIYWAFYFQMFLSLTLFITRVVDPKLFGIAFPAPYYVFVESFGILIIGYFLAMQHQVLNNQQIAIRTSTKFFLSIISIALAYFIIVLSILYNPGYKLIHPLFIIPAYILISISELLISPVGLSVITALADRKRVSTLMGIFFVSLSLGGYLAGILAKITNITNDITDIMLIKTHYFKGFSILLAILLVSIIVSYCLKRAVVHMMLKPLKL